MTDKVLNAPNQNMSVKINWGSDGITGPTKIYSRYGDKLNLTTDSWTMSDTNNVVHKWIDNVIGGPSWFASDKYRFRVDYTLKNIPGGLRGSKYNQAGHSIRRMYFNNGADTPKRNPRIVYAKPQHGNQFPDNHLLSSLSYAAASMSDCISSRAFITSKSSTDAVPSFTALS